MSRVRGVCDDVTCPFLHSGVVQILKAGQVHTNDPFCCPNSPPCIPCIQHHVYTMYTHTMYTQVPKNDDDDDDFPDLVPIPPWVTKPPRFSTSSSSSDYNKETIV